MIFNKEEARDVIVSLFLKKIGMINVIKKPWGSFTDFYDDGNKHIKLIEVNDNARLSLQSHKKRSEQWIVVEGKILVTIIRDFAYQEVVENHILFEGSKMEIKKGWIHRMQAINGPAKVLEIATGKFDEKDIKRIEDDYDRKNTTTV